MWNDRAAAKRRASADKHFMGRNPEFTAENRHQHPTAPVHASHPWVICRRMQYVDPSLVYDINTYMQHWLMGALLTYLFRSHYITAEMGIT